LIAAKLLELGIKSQVGVNLNCANFVGALSTVVEHYWCTTLHQVAIGTGLKFSTGSILKDYVNSHDARDSFGCRLCN
jgi:hypothetical protein